MIEQMTIIPDGVQQELEHAEQKIERAMKNAFYEVGTELQHINERRLYVLRYPTFEEYCEQRWEMSARRAYQLMDACTIVHSLCTNDDLVQNLPTRETHARPLLKLEKDEHRAEVWQRIIDSTNGHGITAKLVEAEVNRKIAELNKAYITLDEWLDLPTEDRQRALARKGDKAFNETNENIEWAAWSWNPVTGCKHGCPYCYAQDIANRFYPHKFEPTFHPDRLTAPQNTKMGQPRWQGDIGYKGVFVCSMADLFGDWVPQEWIDAVLASVQQAPQWTFIFLTKNPKRLMDCEFPANAWVGTTVDRQARVKAAEDAFERVDAPQLFISCEPMLERLTFSRLNLFDWVIVGGQSRSSQQPELQPEWEWVENLLWQARQTGARFYMKTNIRSRPREYPGE